MDEEASSPAELEPDPSSDTSLFDPWIGQNLAGYSIIQRIGEGGMGIVYLARHQSLNRLAAVKFLGAHMVSDKAYVERFLHEARGAAKLNHPNIVQVYDAGSMGEDVYFFIMEYVEGKDLGTLLREMRIIPVGEAVKFARQACAALAYAHRNQIIHRDVKPDNFMLTAESTIKLGDLGLAKWTGDEASGGMTQTGVVMGTPFYISPEQVRGAKDVDARADIYSLGASLFHMVTSKIPFEGPSPAVIMAMHLNNAVPEPSRINPALDRDICAIIKKMMAKKPEERYQSMDEVDAVLAEYQSRKSHPTQPLGQAGKIAEVAPALVAERTASRSPHTRWRSFTVQSEAGTPVKVKIIMGVSFLIGAVLLAVFITWFSRGAHPRNSETPPAPAVASAEAPAEVPPPPPEPPAETVPASETSAPDVPAASNPAPEPMPEAPPPPAVP
jgi:serine/threonine protein kinase